MIGGMVMVKKPMQPVLCLTGKKGHEIFEKILNTPPSNYNAKKEAKKAAKELRKQGYFVW